MPAQNNCDYIIVGARSAGCFVANGVSEKGAAVLLLEAGVDTVPGTVGGDINDLYPRSDYNPSTCAKGLTADQEGAASGVKSPFTQARVTSGGSSLMGKVTLGGLRGEYDNWTAHGAVGWGWEDLLPYFRLLERARDFDAPLQGRDRRVPVRRQLPENWPPFGNAVGHAMVGAGFRTSVTNTSPTATSRRWWVFVGPSLTRLPITVHDPAIRRVRGFQSTSEQRSAQSSLPPCPGYRGKSYPGSQRRVAGFSRGQEPLHVDGTQ